MCGALSLKALPLGGGLYVVSSAGGAAARAIVAALCLLPPTILMGATLPVLARWNSRNPSMTATWAGWLAYATNTLGAVAGALSTGF
jgi:spermidine synthase